MRIVVALGGNALGNTPTKQLKLVKKTAKQLVKIIKKGHDIVIVHGNGPQVGDINLAFESAYNSKIGVPLMPFAECGAMSQGYIGYHLQQAISEELLKNKIDKKCATIITQVEVDLADKAFQNPTKPVGMFYSKDEADRVRREKNYKFVEDAGRGYRRVVPSPKPVSILEQDVIKQLVSTGNIVISCGGGGIPVVKDGNGYKGVDAVIDKDYAACTLATLIEADVLLILTTVPKVYIGYNTKREKGLDVIDIQKANQYILSKEFYQGSMLPKIESSISFVSHNHKGISIIASLEEAVEALYGKTGTKIIYKEEK